MDKSPYRNAVLRKLDATSVKRLKLRQVDLPVGRELEFPGNHIENIFFLEDGIASTTTSFSDGFQVEVAFAGRESVMCASSMMGTKRSLNRVYMQVAGHGFSSPTEAATREFNRGEAFHDMTLRYLQAQFITISANGRMQYPAQS